MCLCLFLYLFFTCVCPDKLPETGPETHVVIIVGVVVVFVVGMALYLLVKYLMYRAQRWQEQCAERNMERAIRLFNSQESPPEPDYMYTALPLPEVDRPRGGGGHGGQSKNGEWSCVPVIRVQG